MIEESLQQLMEGKNVGDLLCSLEIKREAGMFKVNILPPASKNKKAGTSVDVLAYVKFKLVIS